MRFFIETFEASHYIDKLGFLSAPHGTDYKIGLHLSVSLSVSQCVSASVCGHWSLSRWHFLIDFHQNWHRRKNLQK